MKLLLVENYNWIKRFYALPIESLVRKSKCKIGIKEAAFLEDILKNFKVVLLYRASKDGWRS